MTTKTSAEPQQEQKNAFCCGFLLHTYKPLQAEETPIQSKFGKNNFSMSIFEKTKCSYGEISGK